MEIVENEMKQKFYKLQRFKSSLSLQGFLVLWVLWLSLGISSVQGQSIDFDGDDDYITVPNSSTDD